jgi:hypothetical protein
MSNAAKPCFSSLLDGNPGNKFDARKVLTARRERRREMLPWVAIQNFGLTVDEAQNDGGAISGGEAPLSHGGGNQTQN